MSNRKFVISIVSIMIIVLLVACNNDNAVGTHETEEMNKVLDEEVHKNAEGMYSLSSFNNISGSVEAYQGSIVVDTNILTITTDHDFEVGQGISVEGANKNDSHNNWLNTVVTKVSEHEVYIEDAAQFSITEARVIHDDTLAVNEAISQVRGTIIFDYPNLNAKGIELQSNCNYVGAGMTLHLPISYSAVNWVQGMVVANEVSNISFSDFVVDGGMLNGVIGDDITGVALFMGTDIENITISNNTFKNSYYVSINLQGAVKNVSVLNNTILDTDVGVLAMPAWQGELMVDHLIIQDNYIKGGSSEGISIESGMYDNSGAVSDISIRNNTINDKEATGIQYGGRSSKVEIVNNTISYTNSGITTRDENLEKKEALNSENVIIDSNIISDVTYNHMILDGSSITVTNNTMNNGSTAVILGRVLINGLVMENNRFNNTNKDPDEAIVQINVTGYEQRNNAFD